MPADGFLVALFLTVRDVARSREFYSRVLGGEVVREENPCMVRLSNSWLIMNPRLAQPSGPLMPPTQTQPGPSETATPQPHNIARARTWSRR
jgi:catechol 2,3-dioxygenase-like lactoylglutathione lyase family enzyme